MAYGHSRTTPSNDNYADDNHNHADDFHHVIAGSSRESKGTRAPRPLDCWERNVCTSAHLVFLMFKWEGSTTVPSLVAFFVL
eukprot:2827970-Pyramimonas_sp.AAC.1